MYACMYVCMHIYIYIYICGNPSFKCGVKMPRFVKRSRWKMLCLSLVSWNSYSSLSMPFCSLLYSPPKNDCASPMPTFLVRCSLLLMIWRQFLTMIWSSWWFQGPCCATAQSKWDAFCRCLHRCLRSPMLDEEEEANLSIRWWMVFSHLDAKTAALYSIFSSISLWFCLDVTWFDGWCSSCWCRGNRLMPKTDGWYNAMTMLMLVKKLKDADLDAAVDQD